MTNKIQGQDVEEIIAKAAEEVQVERERPIDDSMVVRRNARSKTLQVRLNPDEFADLERVAASRGLPTSTVAREAILGLIRPVKARSIAANRVIEEFTRFIDSFLADDAHHPLHWLPGLPLRRGGLARAMPFIAAEPTMPVGVVPAATIATHRAGGWLAQATDDRYAIYQDTDGYFRLYTTSPTGEIVPASGPFESESDAQRAVASVEESVASNLWAHSS
jgi:uncharacterized protein YegP (UPF0339 family)